MVIIHNDQPPPSSSPDHASLRGTSWNFDLSDMRLQYENFKMKLCQSTMSSCADTMKADRVCTIENQCNELYKELVIPLTHKFCKFASDSCQNTDLEETLKNLYDAGAFSTDPVKSKQIDDQIDELHRLEHKIKVVQSAINYDQARKARQDYLIQRQKNHETQDKENKDKIKIKIKIKRQKHQRQLYRIMESFVIDRLVNAVRVLGLSNEAKIDFPKVKKQFNHLVKSIHPDKNDGVDIGLASILDAYKLLDYYLNVVITGKTCQICSTSRVRENSTGELDHDTHTNDFNYTQNPVEIHNFKNTECTISKSNFSIEPCNKPDRKCSLREVRFNACKIHVKTLNPGRYYTSLLKNDLLFFEGSKYVQCRCGQLINIPEEAISLGIYTFDCDDCSCSYCIADVDRT